MGTFAARNGDVRIGESPEESIRLLDQTSAAILLPMPLDFRGIEDVMELVGRGVSGELLSIREICAVRRSLRAARGLFDQVVEAYRQSDRYNDI